MNKRSPQKSARPRKAIVQPDQAQFAATGFLTEQMLATRWFCSRSRLQHWRSQAKGPQFLKIGARILYAIGDIENFEAARRISTLS